jgi:proliferating cell nuclear antigen
MNQTVALTFSLKYLVNFSKSASLAKEVQLMLSADVPLLVSTIVHPFFCSMLNELLLFKVSYDFQQGTIHYYLAPKIGDD